MILGPLLLLSTFPGDEKSSSKLNDLPFYCIGFKSAAPEFTLRTCIWASLRSRHRTAHFGRDEL